MTALINLHLIDLMNDLYRNEWGTFQNFFCPTLKLKEKQRVNSKYIKKYHPPLAIAGVRSHLRRNKKTIDRHFLFPPIRLF